MTVFFTLGILIAYAATAFAFGDLRMMIIIGSTFYVTYYASVAAEQLYCGIYATIGLMLTNFISMTTLILPRFQISLPAAHTDIFPNFYHAFTQYFHTVISGRR